MLGLKKGVAKEKFINNKNFSIILHKESILLFCLAQIVEIAIAMMDVTIYAIDCLRKGFIDKSDSK